MRNKVYEELANEIGRGNLNSKFEPLNEQDILGASLLAMRENLKASIAEQHSQMLELHRINAELDNFVYHASHDLRAPLTSILGLVNLGLKEKSIKTAHSYFQMIENRINHMDKLLKDLIAISYNKRTEAKYELFDFNAEISLLLQSLKDPGHEFDIRFDIQANVPFITDAIRVRTILANLISNAFKYYNPDANKNYIYLAVIVDFQSASIEIKDNGIGIERKFKEEIFKMFFRASTRSTGTGLGLYIVKSMIDRLQGHISLESKLNEGAKFNLIIPNHLENM